MNENELDKKKLCLFWYCFLVCSLEDDFVHVIASWIVFNGFECDALNGHYEESA